MTETIDFSRAAIANRPHQLGEGLWLHSDCSIGRMSWVEGAWFAYGTRGGEYRQMLFPDGLAASVHQPLGIDNDPRLSERVPWPPPGPVLRGDRAAEIVLFLYIAAVGLAVAVNVGYHPLSRHAPVAVQIRGAREEIMFAFGVGGVALGVAGAAWSVALRVRERRRATRRHGSGVAE